MIQRLVWPATSVATRTRARYAPDRSATQRVRAWAMRCGETPWVVVILAVAALAHGLNMFHIPYYENDEGTYMSQAWAVLREGQLAPYTYIYDHAPVGWLQIAAWLLVTGGVHTFGMVENSGRVFMLILQVGSTFMVYRIARAISRGQTAATISALIFALSPYAIYYHRRVLLDNITTFWMLLSILLLVSGHLSLKRVWLSGLALSISILSKENTVFLVPVLAYLVFYRAHQSHRLIATVGWLAIVGASLSYYLLMALLRTELFPYVAATSAPRRLGLLGTIRWDVSRWLGGTHDHVSLIGTLQWQASRGSKDGSILNPHSMFWYAANLWMHNDPFLVIGGTLFAALSIALIKWRRLLGILGLATLSMGLFLARGGEVLDFYLVPVVPLLALNIGLCAGLGLRWVTGYTSGARRGRSWGGVAMGTALAGLCVAALVPGYRSPQLGFAKDPFVLWHSRQTVGQQEALTWIEKHIPVRSRIIMDDYLWVDLHDRQSHLATYTSADWYWKVDLDTAIKNNVFHANWRNIDYIISTPQLLTNANLVPLPIVKTALAHSTRLVRFDTGQWAVDILRVDNGHSPRLIVAPAIKRPRPQTPPRYWFGACVSACPGATPHP